MVEDRYRQTLNICFDQVVATLETARSLDPQTQGERIWVNLAIVGLELVQEVVETLLKHNYACDHSKPPPKEGDHDLP